MPRGDRTGPQGLGPMTGRAMGYCAGNTQPGYVSYGYGFGRRSGWWGGFHRGGGRGRGFGWAYPAVYPYSNAYPYAPVVDDAYRIDSLEQQARYLEDSLAAIRKEIAETKASKAED